MVLQRIKPRNVCRVCSAVPGTHCACRKWIFHFPSWKKVGQRSTHHRPKTYGFFFKGCHQEAVLLAFQSTDTRDEFCSTPAEKYRVKKVVLLMCSQISASAVESIPWGCCAFWVITGLTCERRALPFTCKVTTPSGQLAWKAGAAGPGTPALHPAPPA